MITILGLGPGDLSSLTLDAWKELENQDNTLWFRTNKHPVAEALKQKGIRVNSFDHFYSEAEEFHEVYSRIAEELVQQATGGRVVVYAVPGHPEVAEASTKVVRNKAEEQGVEVRMIPGMSSLEAVYGVLGVDPTEGLIVTDALLGDAVAIDPRLPMLITQVYSRLVASDLKLKLLDTYPPELEVTVVREGGTSRCRVSKMELHELDHYDYGHADMVYLPAAEGSLLPGQRLDELIYTMARLRSEEGCPWDREQTHESLRPYLIEETYEVLDAIDEGDEHKLAEELGDLLLQIVFHSQIAAENGEFQLEEPIRLINEKMVRRHPHVFGDIKVADSKEVLSNWQSIKEKERGSRDREGSFLDSVDRSLPALIEATKVQARARETGFDWPNIDGALEKVYEELAEVKEARGIGDAELIREELGDLLFAVVNVARFVDVEPETALRQATRKFRKRFEKIELLAKERSVDMQEAGLEELDKLWNEVKRKK